MNQKWIEISYFLRKILCTFHFSCFWIFGHLLFVVGKKIDFFFRPNDGLVAKISKVGYSPFRDISHKQLGLFLRCCEFIRFENVKLYYNDYDFKPDFQSIGKKCHLFVKHLKPLKTAFSDSTKIEFNADMGEGQNKFRDPLQLLNHLRNELLPVCDSARRYKFAIRFFSHKASTTAILDSILKMAPINSSANVEFNLYQPNSISTHSVDAIDAISAWLDRSNDAVMKCKQQQKKPIELSVYLRGVQNVQELCEHFKKVHFDNSLLKLFLNVIEIVK